jgi:hypothetical protein
MIGPSRPRSANPPQARAMVIQANMFWSASVGDGPGSVGHVPHRRGKARRGGLTDGEQEDGDFTRLLVEYVHKGEILESSDIVIRRRLFRESQGVSPCGMERARADKSGQDGDPFATINRGGEEYEQKNHWNDPTAMASMEINNMDNAFFLLNNPE